MWASRGGSAVTGGGSLGREAGCYCPGSLRCLVRVLSHRVPEPSSSHRQPWAPKKVCMRVYRHWYLNSHCPGSHHAAVPYQPVGVSLAPIHAHPRPPESVTGASGHISGAAAALASSTLDLGSSQTGSKATGKPASMQHNSSQPSSKSNFNKDF